MVESVSADFLPVNKKLFDMVAFANMNVALAKPRSVRRASHKPALIDICLSVTHVCPIYLVYELVQDVSITPFFRLNGCSSVVFHMMLF